MRVVCDSLTTHAVQWTRPEEGTRRNRRTDLPIHRHTYRQRLLWTETGRDTKRQNHADSYTLMMTPTRRMHRDMETQRTTCRGRQLNRCRETRTDRCTRQINRQTRIQCDWHTLRQIDRRTGRHTCMLACSHAGGQTCRKAGGRPERQRSRKVC